MQETHAALTVALALATGIVAQSVARHLKVPGIVLLLLAGAALGPDLLGWVEPRALGDGLLLIVDLAVAIILFEGGLNLEIRRLRREQSSIRRLVSLGAGVTLVGGALAAGAFFAWPWRHCLLFGSLVVVTGPTVIGPLIQELRLRPRVAALLEAEGVLIDPIGAILAVLMLEIAIASGTPADQATGLVLRLGFGATAGVVAGFAVGGMLRVGRLLPEGHENIFVLASVLLLFEGCEALVSQSGLMAVTLAGVVVGNQRTRVDRDLREFKDQLTVMLIGLLFVLLAADVRLEDVRALGWRGIGVVAVLVFAVRPLCVWVSTFGSDLTHKERWLVAWIAPRGIVAAAVASVTAAALERAGIPGGTELRALVFLTIAGTVILAGLTSLPVAAFLGLRLPGRESVVILGAGGLGLALAQALRDAKRSVVFLDSNPVSCRRAEEAGFTVIYGDAMQERTMLRARPEGVGLAIGLTANQMLNSVFVDRALDRFGVPQGYMAAQRPGEGLATEVVSREKASLLFEGPHDVERWDVRSRQNQVEVERWVYSQVSEETKEGEEEKKKPAIGERLVLLTVMRGSKTQPMHTKFKLRDGDVVSVAVFTEERDAAHEVLRALGFLPAEPQAGD
jgi:NhaP-type Na+/H+ or K+/H+ antiporter/Trk K+ transport system NAD-binding subunit